MTAHSDGRRGIVREVPALVYAGGRRPGGRNAAMARAASRRRPPDGSSSLEERAELLHGLMSELCHAAVTFVSQAKLEETARHWLADSRIKDDEEHGAAAVGEALALALDVALFSPSASGT